MTSPSSSLINPVAPTRFGRDRREAVYKPTNQFGKFIKETKMSIYNFSNLHE